MAKRHSELTTDSSGQYFRQLGYKHGIKGQPKFRLGKDRASAQLAYQRLGLLWDVVVEEHAHRGSTVGEEFAPPDTLPRRPGPVWHDEAMLVARAICKYQHVVRLPKPDNIDGDSAYAAYIDHARQLYGRIIAVLPEDEESAKAGKESHAQWAQHRSRQATLNARIAQIPIPAGVIGQTLYAAIDAFAESILERNKKESGKVSAANALRLKDSTPDMDLSDFGYTAIERIAAYWASRPEAKARGGKGLGRPISIQTVGKQVMATRRFIHWLERVEAFRWEPPKHAHDALKVDLKRLRTDDEVANMRHGVQVFTVEQLEVIYRYATQQDRLFLLLGLNAGMAQAEILTLRWHEVEERPPTIKRVRQKSGVYGEFAIWPETWSALQSRAGTLGRREGIVVLTDRGNPYTRQQISNAWESLRKRIERKTGESINWWLSFKHLRKTAAQLVRDASDGEIAGVFLCHGTPVTTDELADVYSNRPFHRVQDALVSVHKRLATMFAAGQSHKAC